MVLLAQAGWQHPHPAGWLSSACSAGDTERTGMATSLGSVLGQNPMPRHPNAKIAKAVLAPYER